MAKYYSTNSNRAYTTQQYIANYGFNPDNADQTVLRTIYSTYPVNEAAVPVVDTNVYSGATATYLINIDNVTYDEVYTLVERPLASAKSLSIAKLNDVAEYDSIIALGGTPIFSGDELDAYAVNGPYQKQGGESEAILTTQSYLTAANRIEPYKTIAVNINAIATQLQADVAAVNAATTVSEVKLAYRPVTGDLDITRSGNNITSGVFNTLTGADVSEMVLVIQSSGYIMNYDANNGGFTATGGQLAAGADDVELFVGTASLGLFTIPSGNATTNFTF